MSSRCSRRSPMGDPSDDSNSRQSSSFHIDPPGTKSNSCNSNSSTVASFAHSDTSGTAVSKELVHHQEEEDDSRAARARERNREHARRTRRRKKEALQGLRQKVTALEQERNGLQRQVEDCSVAGILLALSTSSAMNNNEKKVGSQIVTTETPADTTTADTTTTSGAAATSLMDHCDQYNNTDKRKRRVDQSQSHWKTTGPSRSSSSLSSEQIETLRRERNRMHAKMTRDRKKCLISAMETNLQDLQAHVDHLKAVLLDASVTPVTAAAPDHVVSATADEQYNVDGGQQAVQVTPDAKFVQHDVFVLNDTASSHNDCT